MFEPLGSIHPTIIPPSVQKMFDLLNDGLPSFIIPDAEKLYLKIMLQQQPKFIIKHILPVMRRIIGWYAKANENFDPDMLISIYEKHESKINFYSNDIIPDPEAEGLALIAKSCASELGLNHDITLLQ